MSFNTFGQLFRFTTWGESHGPALGVVVDGCPPGIPISAEIIQRDLDRRKPGQSRFTTQRREEDLVTILTQPKNALVKQYQKLFEIEKVKLSFTKEALRAIAREAMRRSSGARGLRAIMEDAMLDIMYDVPYREGVRECKITQEVVTKHEPPQLVLEKEKKTA